MVALELDAPSTITAPVSLVLRWYLAPILPYLVPGKVWLAGGALVRYFEGEAENNGDWDLYTNNHTELITQLEAVADPERASEFSTTYQIDHIGQVQVMHPVYADEQAILSTFDFTARMWATDGITLTSHVGAEAAVRDKLITFNPGDNSNPLTGLFSIAKYAKRGYTLGYNDASKFLKAWGVTKPLQVSY